MSKRELLRLIGTSPRAVSEDELFLALYELQRSKQRALAAGDQTSAYARAQALFEKRSARQRRDRLLSEQLVGETFGQARRSLPRVQHEIEIVGPVGGQAAGRFQLENRNSARVRVEWLSSDAVSGGSAPPLRFEPDDLELDPGEVQLVRVCADLSHVREPGSVTVFVETRAGALRDSLWLTIRSQASRSSEVDDG